MHHHKSFLFIDMSELNDKYYNSCDDGCLHEVHRPENLGGDRDSGEARGDPSSCVKHRVQSVLVLEDITVDGIVDQCYDDGKSTEPDHYKQGGI